MTLPRPNPTILDIAPYVPGASKIAGVERVIKLASNESALGPSPRVIDAYREAAASIARYPDPATPPLREALAERFGLDAARIITSNGSESVIDLLVRCFVGPGDEVLFPAVTFPLYRIVTLAAGGVPREAEAPGFTADIDALLKAVTAKTKIVFLANPNNPTGTWIAADEVRRLRAGLPDHVLLVIDAAYADYLEGVDERYNACFDLVEAGGNTVVTRTFSKLYALANLRLGWAYAPANIAEALLRVRLPFIVNTPAMMAGVAALADRDHAKAALDHNARWLPKMAARLRDLGFAPTQSACNFVFFPVPEAMGGMAAADAFLKSRGLIARPIPPAGALRVTIGRDDENEAFLAAMADFSREAGQ